MRRLKALVVCGAVLVGSLALTGCSTYELVKGDLTPLAGETQLNIEFDYQGMSVGKYAREDTYTQKKVAAYNAKTSGRGDMWLAEWKSNREDFYEPKFKQLLNLYLRKAVVRASTGLTRAKYTLLVKTLHTEIGWNVGVLSQPAHINLQTTIVETGNRSHEIAELVGNKIIGQSAWGPNFTVVQR